MGVKVLRQGLSPQGEDNFNFKSKKIKEIKARSSGCETFGSLIGFVSKVFWV